MTDLELAVTKFMLGEWKGPITRLQPDTGPVVYVDVGGTRLAIELMRVVSKPYNGVHIEYKAGLQDRKSVV